MLKKFLCLLGAGVMLFSFAACNGNGGEETTTEEPTTAFVSYVIAKEIAANLPEGKVLSEYNGKKYMLIEYNEKQCIASETSRGNLEVIYEFNGEFELLDEANKRTSGSYVYFVENPGTKKDSALKALYLPNAVVMTVVNAPCSNFTVLDIPENYEMYPYGYIATAKGIEVINLKECSISSYSKELSDISSFFEAPEAFFATGKRGAYTYTSIEATDRQHITISIFDVNAKGEEELTAKLTFNPINGVFRDRTEK
ncbi:MAG: hypothetical protein IKK09_08660 [Clostridia bacterium]|nr:hypothetical protein [Clostridia bacterium]